MRFVAESFSALVALTDFVGWMVVGACAVIAVCGMIGGGMTDRRR